MKLILTREVAKLGNAGDVVTVKDGYARNFLLRAAAFAPLFLGSFKARLFLAPIVVLLFEGPSPI